MQKLHFPQPDLRLQRVDESVQVWDVIRKQWVALTPEEWVRQHLIHYLIDHRGWSQSLMSVEKTLRYNGLTRRADLVLYSRTMQPVLLAECKAPDVSVGQAALDQAALYNRAMGVSFVLVTNGLHTSCGRIVSVDAPMEWLNDIPHANT